VLIISLKLPNVSPKVCQMCKKVGLTSYHILNAPVRREGGSSRDYNKVTIMRVARSDRQFVGSFLPFLLLIPIH